VGDNLGGQDLADAEELGQVGGHDDGSS
jgi:hypothetical protein